MEDVLIKQKFTTRIWGKWWFWFIVVLLSVGVWYTKGYIESSTLTQSEIEMQKQKLTWWYMDAQNEKRLQETKDMLQADTYGGKTPEETLKLFVEAIKIKDADLASKYYLPWKQKEAKKEMQDWFGDYPDGLEKFLNTYRDGYIQRDSVMQRYITIDIYENKIDKYPYSIDMQLNNQNNIWKIEKF